MLIHNTLRVGEECLKVGKSNEERCGVLLYIETTCKNSKGVV